MYLKNKIGVVTGATSGIGWEIAKVLLEGGMKLYLLGRSFDRIQDQFGNDRYLNQYQFIYVDLNQSESIEQSLESIHEEVGIDILIHSAGSIYLSEMENGSLPNFDEQYRINLRAPYHISKSLIPLLRKKKGQIFFLNSTAGIDSWAEIGQYAATKHGIRAIADSLRKEVKDDHIKVTSIFCGSVDTPMQESVQKMRGNKYHPDQYMDAQAIADLIYQLLILPDNMTVTDITVTSN